MHFLCTYILQTYTYKLAIQGAPEHTRYLIDELLGLSRSADETNVSHSTDTLSALKISLPGRYTSEKTGLYRRLGMKMTVDNPRGLAGSIITGVLVPNS